MMPSAPGRFSTTTATFQYSRSLSAMMRARMSVVPPGTNPTTTRTERVGKSVAERAGEVTMAAPSEATIDRRVREVIMRLRVLAGLKTPVSLADPSARRRGVSRAWARNSCACDQLEDTRGRQWKRADLDAA